MVFGNKQLTYDANGSVTSVMDPSGTTILTWDARNRLIGMTGPGLTASFVYDAFGRRIKKTVNGSTTGYVYDGLTLVQEIHDGATIDYLTGLILDEPWIRNGNELYLADGLGSVIALVDSAGTVTARYTYEPFGTTSQELGASTNPLQYTARENDGTGLYYYRARYYHPGLQRFLSEDPIGLAGGDPNLYAYVRNNPLNFRDPLGNVAIADDAAILIGLGVLGAVWLASPQGQQAVRDTIEGVQQFAETTIEALQSLMGRKQRESGLEHLSDAEIKRRARDKSLPVEERRRYAREEKYRDLRDKGKDRGGPTRSGFMALEPALPWDVIELDGPVPLSGRKR